MVALVMEPTGLKDQRVNVAFQGPAALETRAPNRFRTEGKTDDCGHGDRVRKPEERKATP